MTRSSEEIASIIVDSAIAVHKTLGPGLLESAYQACLVYELNKRGLSIEVQKPLPIIYKSIKLDAGYRIDILVENKIIIELKAVEALNDLHLAQVITYLRLSDNRLGFLINFNVKLLKQGLRRVVNNYKPDQT